MHRLWRGELGHLLHHLLALSVVLADTQSRALSHAVRVVPRATLHQLPPVLRLVYHVPREATLWQEQRRAQLVQRELGHLLHHHLVVHVLMVKFLARAHRLVVMCAHRFTILFLILLYANLVPMGYACCSFAVMCNVFMSCLMELVCCR